MTQLFYTTWPNTSWWADLKYFSLKADQVNYSTTEGSHIHMELKITKVVITFKMKLENGKVDCTNFV